MVSVSVSHAESSVFFSDSLSHFKFVELSGFDEWGPGELDGVPGSTGPLSEFCSVWDELSDESEGTFWESIVERRGELYWIPGRNNAPLLLRRYWMCSKQTWIW